MSIKRRKECKKIIRLATTAAGAMGAANAQLPLGDVFSIVTVQAYMLKTIAAVYDKPVSLGIVTSMGAAALAQLGSRAISQIVIGWIPGYGNIVNAATAAGLTESMGWLMVKAFDRAA